MNVPSKHILQNIKTGITKFLRVRTELTNELKEHILCRFQTLYIILTHIVTFINKIVIDVTHNI